MIFKKIQVYKIMKIIQDVKTELKRDWNVREDSI